MSLLFDKTVTVFGKVITKNNSIAMLHVSGVAVEVHYKKIKSLRLKVLWPNGDVRLSAPLGIRQSLIADFIQQRVQWIRAQQMKIAALPVKPSLQYIDGEELSYLGKTYKLTLCQSARQKIQLTDTRLELHHQKESTKEQRERQLNNWYKKELKSLLPVMLTKWQPIVGQEVSEWGVKKMKTRWGSCNIHARRIWLNTELIKKPMGCIEMVLVHELVHFYERYHNEHFYQLMTRFMPEWRSYDALLNAEQGGCC